MQKPYINHALHIVLTLITGGFWLFIYVPLLIDYSNKMRQYNAWVASFGGHQY